MRVEDTEVGGFDVKLFFLYNLITGVATDIGSRILYLADIERPDINLFGVLPEARTQTQEGFWRIYGGHRFWSSPEAKPRSYLMDNEPVRIVAGEDSVAIHGNAEPENSVKKKIAIKPSSQNSIEVTHTIKNIGQWPIRLDCWALSVMRKHGFAVIPMKSSKLGEEGLLPDRRVTFWPYTDLSDSRLRFTKGYIFSRQDPTAETPCKVGAMANPPWTAYWVDGMVLVKRFAQADGEYPDFGCNVEVYTNSDMLELETVGPLRTVSLWNNPAYRDLEGRQRGRLVSRTRKRQTETGGSLEELDQRHQRGLDEGDVMHITSRRRTCQHIQRLFRCPRR